MPAIGRGPLPDPIEIDPNIYDRWLVPSASAQEKSTYYALGIDPGTGEQAWFLMTGRIIRDTDAVMTANGVYSFSEITEALTKDYGAIVRQGLI